MEEQGAVYTAVAGGAAPAGRRLAPLPSRHSFAGRLGDCGRYTLQLRSCGSCKAIKYCRWGGLCAALPRHITGMPQGTEPLPLPCSVECQKAHWREHKPRCKELTKAKAAAGSASSS